MKSFLITLCIWETYNHKAPALKVGSLECSSNSKEAQTPTRTQYFLLSLRLSPELDQKISEETLKKKKKKARCQFKHHLTFRLSCSSSVVLALAPSFNHKPPHLFVSHLFFFFFLSAIFKAVNGECEPPALFSSLLFSLIVLANTKISHRCQTLKGEMRKRKKKCPYVPEPSVEWI